jgi:IS30 family transposase
MPNCRSIEERPKVVEQRKRVGAWEADTIIGQHHQPALRSLRERESKLCLLKRVERNTALEVEQASCE